MASGDAAGGRKGGEEEEKNRKENSKRAPERNADSLLQISYNGVQISFAAPKRYSILAYFFPPIMVFFSLAFHRGYMRRCYHQRCDFPGNPELEPEGLYFMAKTAQALVLAAAELSGALDGGRCDLGPLGLKPEEEQEKSPSDEYEAMPRMAEEEEEEEGAGGEF